MKSKLAIIFLVIIYSLQSNLTILAAYDRDILADPVKATYTADGLGTTILTNLNFLDVPVSHWAKDPITRLGALQVIKGYNEGASLSYRPNDSVTNEEALALVLRVVGQEGAAILAAEAIASNPGDPLLTMWSRGYLQIAANLGLISGAQLADGLVLDQASLDPTFSFMRRDSVNRQQIAMWLVQAINGVNPGAIVPIYELQNIFTLSDWEAIDQVYVPYVEAVMRAGIMVGDGNRFNPKASLTRAEIAQILINMDEILYKTMALTQKSGVVGYIDDRSVIGALNTNQQRDLYIRNQEGEVDRLRFTLDQNALNQVSTRDVPVLTPQGLKGLASLKEGDQVVYLVDEASQVLKYVAVKSNSTTTSVKGYLQPLSDLINGKITIKNSAGNSFTYNLSVGLYDVGQNKIKIDSSFYQAASAPIASMVTLELSNNLVTKVVYDGNRTLRSEVSGIVKEVNPNLGFITIEAWDGGELTYYFNAGDLRVEKQNHYDTEDEIGYIDEVYPNYAFDERDTTVEALEVGDVVHMVIDTTDGTYVTDISAKTNYSVKFGQVLELSDQGALGTTLRLTYSDGTIGSLLVPKETPVKLRTANVGTNGLIAGQMVKILINQAVLAPGTTKESVKQIDIDPYGNLAAHVYKGGFGLYDVAKKQVGLLNSYELTKAGWLSYASLRSLEIADSGLELYYKGKQVSMAYADTYLRTANMQLYVVTKTHFGREKVAKVIFTEGRGDILNTTNIAYTNGFSSLRLVNSATTIGVDPSTIVVKDGHIVSTTSLLSPDYAQVVLGDAGSAVIVNVMAEPNNDAISVFRGRIDSIVDGQKFTVESNAILKDMEWVYSPIERQYTMDFTTKIKDADGAVSLSEFIDYSDLSKVDEVYTIIAQGTKATHLIKNPYATDGVIGEIYNVGQDAINIKDVLVYQGETKIWQELSLKNSYAVLEVPTESVIIKNNKVVSLSDLEIGDKIRAMVTVDLAEQLKLTGNRNTTGYIFFVEN